MVKRGEVRWAQLEPVVGHEQAGHRPVLVVSVDRFNEKSGLVIVVPLTSRDKWSPPLQVEVGVIAKKPGYALPGQTRTLSTARLGKLLGIVGDDVVDRCLDAFLEICGRRPRRSTSANDG